MIIAMLRLTASGCGGTRRREKEGKGRNGGLSQTMKTL